MTLAHVVLPSVFVLYASYRYGWDSKTIGLTLAGVGICSGAVQGGLVGPIVKRLGEFNTLLFGLVCGVAGFAVSGFAPVGTVFWAGIPLLALWGLASAVIQGMMTEHVASTEQGQLQGANGSLRGIAEFVGPSIFTMTFAAFIGAERNLPGAPFYLLRDTVSRRLRACLVDALFIIADSGRGSRKARRLIGP